MLTEDFSIGLLIMQVVAIAIGIAIFMLLYPLYKYLKKNS